MAGHWTWNQLATLLAFLSFRCVVLSTGKSSGSALEDFSPIEDGFLCIRDEFIRTDPLADSLLSCAKSCSNLPLCQAFSMQPTVDWGACKLFVFDRCSKKVRQCSCSTRGRVFVRRIAGLAPGTLCPAGYGNDLCGSKYRLYPDTDFWRPSRQRCDSETGLVIMSDAEDVTEMRHIDTLCSNRTFNTFLGGYQLAGSSEPAGGWVWASCGTPIDARLWSTGEPNDNRDQNIVARWHDAPHLSDVSQVRNDGRGVLCQCVSPFD